MSKRATPRTRTPVTSRPSRHVREAQQRLNKLIFGVPLGPWVSAEFYEFSIVVLNNRDVMTRKGQNLTAAHNDMVNQFLSLRAGSADYLVWLEHDHDFNARIVFAYFEHLDPKKYPIVGLLYPERMPPWLAVGYQREEDGTFRRFSDEELDEFEAKPGLYPVTGGVGMGVTAIHRSVFETLAKDDPEAPWYHWPATKTGEMTDDIWFCQRAIAAGFPVHVETRFNVGHYGQERYTMRHTKVGRQLMLEKKDQLAVALEAQKLDPQPAVGETRLAEGEVPVGAGAAESFPPHTQSEEEEAGFKYRDKRKVTA